MASSGDNDPARASLLARAFCYPYERPRHAFCFSHGQARPAPRLRSNALALGAHGQEVWIDGLGFHLPVLAVGSNAAIQTLRRKFGSKPAGLFQHPAWLSGFDVVHSAHVARYGALPATLVPKPATTVSVHLQFVPSALIHDLDASEALGINYQRVWTNAALFMPTLGRRLTGAWTYQSLHGPLILEGSVVSLGSQRAVLARVAAHLGWSGPLAGFVEALVRDPTLRRTLTRALKPTSITDESGKGTLE